MILTVCSYAFIGTTYSPIFRLIFLIPLASAFIVLISFKLLKWDNKTAGLVVVVSVIISITLFGWLDQVFYSSSLSWFPPIVVMAVYLRSRRFSYLISLILVMIIIALHIHTRGNGLIESPSMDLNLQMNSTLMDQILTVVFTFALIYFHERNREKTQKQLEFIQGQMFQQSKMSAMGQMANGIAHEINNPITTINLSVERIKKMQERNLLTPEALHNYLDTIDVTVNRIGNVISSLRVLTADATKTQKTTVVLKNLITDILAVYSEKLKMNNVELRINNDSPVFDKTINANHAEIGQILLNLIRNSYDAIEDLKDKWIEIKIVEQKNNIVIKVIDSGEGIAADLQEKIFLPFYTSKDVGKGTGLGLSICKIMVENNGGTLSLDTSLAHTCFDITLPKPKQ